MTTPLGVLIAHQRASASSCYCGWSELGASFVEHQLASLAEARYVVVPQAELDERIRDAFVHAVAVGMAAERIGCEPDDLLAEAEEKVAATDAQLERQRATAGPEGPRGGGDESNAPEAPGADQHVKPDTPWYQDPATLRAFAIDRYRAEVAAATDAKGDGYSANERTLILIGYASGWDDHAGGRMRDEAAASERLLRAIEEVDDPTQPESETP